MMDFSNFKTGKKANALQFEADVEEKEEKGKLDKKKQVLDPTLSVYKKVYQYCDGCKLGVSANIIMNRIVCPYCNHSYTLEERKMTK
jgi:hypothetical protein